MRKLRWSIPTALALMLVMSVAAFAAPPPPPPPLPPTLLPTAIPQWINTLPRLITEIPVVGGQTVDISLCEFQTSILPTGTVLAGGAAPAPPLTWVWGYDDTTNCSTTPTVSYVGPVILAQRGFPTQVTYYNNLPDASPFNNVNGSNVKAYTLSTDQTLQWADPFSLDRNGNFLAPPGDPELNDCNAAVKIPGLLPTPCLNNYGFLAPQPTANTYLAPVPAAPHLHGGEIPAELDGGPDAWWTPTGIRAHGYYTMGNPAPNAAIYRYPNVQEPAPTWFHDHVLGATRLNVYAGIAGAYYQYDPTTGFPLPANLDPLGLPNGAAASPGGAPTVELLVPLVIQDRMFDPNGELFFPAAGFNTNPEHPFWVPEFVGDVIVVNGKAWPQLNVEPKRYRFLVLNGSNARSYELFLVNLAKKGAAPTIWVIGNDQGYLDAPVAINPAARTNNKLIIMPGERYEVIIDFGAFPGATFQMRNTAGTPYPGGAPVAVGTTDRIVQFVVGANNATGCSSTFCAALDPSYDPATLAPIRTANVNAIQRLVNPATGTVAANVTVDQRRVLTLNEVMGPGGPLEILMNNTTYTGEESAAQRALAGFNDFTPRTTQWKSTQYSELPVEGTTELWEIVNLTADAHPIHPHLVAFQILNRQTLSAGYTAAYDNAFPAKAYTPGFGPPCNYNDISVGACAPPKKRPAGYMLPLGGNPDPTFYVVNGVFPPLPAEQGWKDTAISYPGEVLRMLVRFAPTTVPAGTAAASAFYEFDPSFGHGYVWHCHIIDHEDNEMMRPFSVIANPGAPTTRAYQKGFDY